jgi:hypothetical protein
MFYDYRSLLFKGVKIFSILDSILKFYGKSIFYRLHHLLGIDTNTDPPDSVRAGIRKIMWIRIHNTASVFIVVRAIFLL